MNIMVSGFPLSYQKHHHPLSASQSQEPLDIICHVPPIFHLLLGQVLSPTMEPSGIAQHCLTAQTCHQHITSSLKTICSYRVKCTLLDQHPSLCPLPHLAQFNLPLQTQKYRRQVVVCSIAHICSTVGHFSSVPSSLTHQTPCMSHLSCDKF